MRNHETMLNEHDGGSRPAGRSADLRDMLAEVHTLVRALHDAEERNRSAIARVHPRHRASATNLAHYVELRRHDIRPLQDRLARYGLSSIGRTESRVLPSLHAVAAALGSLAGDGPVPPADPEAMDAGPRLLAANATALLGPRPAARLARIMVTLPTEAAHNPELVAGMVARGMDIARINGAHDGPREWDAMISNVRRAEGNCLVAMDLAGPKLRTGPVEPGAAVVKVKPLRSATGTVLEAGRLILVAPQEPVPSGGNLAQLPRGADAARVPVRDRQWLEGLRPGDRISVLDARGAERRLRVERTAPEGVLATTVRTVYLVPGLDLVSSRSGRTVVGPLPALPRFPVVRAGERIVLTRSLTPAVVVPGGPHRIGCSLPQAFEAVRPGHRVFLDDGRIGGTVTAAGPEEILVEVTAAGADGWKLRAEKGINFPDSSLDLPALTDADIEVLAYAAGHADIVDYSFVRTAGDVADLLSRLEQHRRADLGVVLKIETVEAFRNLPQILLEALRAERVGVMIARGDLAVEAGFERLAEMQEEILWVCEAAHVPVVWATDVLDTLARTGLPSRAEVTDAAMADRAECVMLNKGPYILDAIAALSNILARMHDHQAKKRALLRRLRSWDLEPGPGS